MPNRRLDNPAFVNLIVHLVNRRWNFGGNLRITKIGDDSSVGCSYTDTFVYNLTYKHGRNKTTTCIKLQLAIYYFKLQVGKNILAILPIYLDSNLQYNLLNWFIKTD